LTAFGRIYAGAVEWVMKLPARLPGIARDAITKMGEAIGRGVGFLKKKAGEIVDAVIKEIKALPGQLLHLGADFLNAGKTLGGKILSGIGSGLGAIGDLAGRIAADLKAGINRVIGLPKDISISVLGKHIGFTIPGFAKGGVAPGGLAWVGEQGPELVNLPRGSRVHSNRDSERMAAANRSMSIVINNPIPEPASTTVSRAANIGFLLGLS
jgi:phage-related tail protein